MAEQSGIRISKLMSEAGIASRRASEELIRQGRVLVDGVPAILGQRVDPERDRIEVDGQRLHVSSQKRYYMMNKPVGVISTVRDPDGRTTIIDLLGETERVFPVGRLDIATEGMILLTNDGELTHRLTHPSFGIPKTYVAELAGRIDHATLRDLKDKGVRIDRGRPARAVSTRILASSGGRSPRSVVEISVHEGRKHVVRKMFETVGHPVSKLVRTMIGPLRLGRLAPGTYRSLTREEVESLYREAGL